MTTALIAGGATADITPDGSQFLFGYPHVRRYSTGVHDRLLSSAVFLCDGRTPLLWVGNDVIYVSRQTARRVRDRIERRTGVPAGNIMITATHTHSGPLTADTLSNEGDAAIPKTDPHYVEQLEDGIVRAAAEAVDSGRPAEIGFATADGSCVGTNRHDPAGPSDPEVPVVVVRERGGGAFVGAMVVCSMHPTVLHEDSTLLSGDFPAGTRQFLQDRVLGKDCPLVYHTGPCGNQSPRHVTRANTFDEARRLGEMLGRSIGDAIGSMKYTSDAPLGCAHALVNLPARKFPTAAEARQQVAAAAKRLETLQRARADRRDIRTAECDCFGAEETLALARAAEEGRSQAAIDCVMPAEIMLMRMGSRVFAGWPGECFVEFALKVKAQYPMCSVISMANGELQGYLVTEEAMRKKWYEGLNSLFASPESGMMLVNVTLEMLRQQNGTVQER